VNMILPRQTKESRLTHLMYLYVDALFRSRCLHRVQPSGFLRDHFNGTIMPSTEWCGKRKGLVAHSCKK
jgi:hypothetical protein